MDQNIKQHPILNPNVIYYGAQLPKHNQTQQIMERFTIVINQQSQIQQYTKRLQFSRHPNICQIKYINFQSMSNNNKFQQYFYSIYTDFLMPLLSWNVMAIQQILKGFKFLMEVYGPFYVKENMVWRDQHERVKVWINQNPAINVPSRLVQSQTEMVSSIKKLILRKNRNVSIKIKSCQYFDSLLGILKDLQFKGDSICIYRSKSPSMLQHNRRMSFVDNNHTFSKLSMKKHISLDEQNIKSRAYSFDPEAMKKFEINSPQQYLQMKNKFSQIVPLTPNSPINESIQFEQLEQQKKNSFIHQSYCQDAKRAIEFQDSKKKLPKFLIKKISENHIQVNEKNGDQIKYQVSPRRTHDNESKSKNREKNKSQYFKNIQIKPKYWTSLKTSQMKREDSPSQKPSQSRSKSKGKTPQKNLRLKQNLKIITKFTSASSKPLVPNANKVSTPKFKDHLLKNNRQFEKSMKPSIIYYSPNHQGKNGIFNQSFKTQNDSQIQQISATFKKRNFYQTSNQPILQAKDKLPNGKIPKVENLLQARDEELPKSDSTFTLRKNQKVPSDQFINQLNQSVQCVSLLQMHQAQLIQEKLKQKKQCFADLKKQAEKVLFDCFR